MKKRNLFLLMLVLTLSMLNILPYSFAETATLDNDRTERIISYDSDIVIESNKTISVTENIKVFCNQENIKHGIYISFADKCNIIEVLKNGIEEDYKIIDQDKGMQVWIGKADVELSPGEYIYTIKFKADSLSAFSENNDEFYYNVIGEWSFPIESASAKISGLKNISSENCLFDGNTGFLGSNEKNFTYYIDTMGNVVFKTTKKLEINQVFSIIIKSQGKLIGDNNQISTFSDLTQNHWAYQAISAMAQEGIIKGYSDGTFRPNNNVTREQFATMMVRTLNIPTTEPAVPTFKDINQESWAYKYVEAAKDYLIGYQKADGLYFNGNSNAIREDMAYALVMAKGYGNETVDVSRLASIFTDMSSISVPMRKYVLIAYDKGLMTGNTDKTFKAKNTLSRAEAAQLLYKAALDTENEVVD